VIRSEEKFRQYSEYKARYPVASATLPMAGGRKLFVLLVEGINWHAEG
jgi:hypothetical protein